MYSWQLCATVCACVHRRQHCHRHMSHSLVNVCHVPILKNSYSEHFSEYNVYSTLEALVVIHYINCDGRLLNDSLLSRSKHIIAGLPIRFSISRWCVMVASIIFGKSNSTRWMSSLNITERHPSVAHRPSTYRTCRVSVAVYASYFHYICVTGFYYS